MQLSPVYICSLDVANNRGIVANFVDDVHSVPISEKK
jgi:hypothetical protein